MDLDLKRPKLPEISINSAESKSLEISIQSLHSEPEMEEFNEEALVKTLLKELNMETTEIQIDPFTHNENIPIDHCLHCKLVKKLSGLKKEIMKINSELNSATETINLKRQQNIELKNTVNKLENNLKGKDDGLVLEQKEKGCSCGSACSIY